VEIVKKFHDLGLVLDLVPGGFYQPCLDMEPNFECRCVLVWIGILKHENMDIKG